MTTKSEPLFLTRAMASIVEELHPEKLAQLRQRFPGHQQIFDTAFELGEPGTEPAAQQQQDQSAALAVRSLIDETVLALEPTVRRIELALVKRIHRARKFRLTGSIVATVSSASAVATMIAAQPVLAPVASVISLFATLAMLLGEHFEKPVMGGSKSLSEILGNVLAAEPAIQEIKLRLMAEDVTQAGPLMEMARKLNEISANIKYASLYGGVPLA